ncbi:MAG: Gfo/Idh/MocA family oxidoreductase [Kiritimatiellaeota bacterium]|nr:Gfo/Idh/MocA family oxidoreductase [Kiritimatiellota bacterium]
MKHVSLNRRSFLKSSAAVAAGLALPSLVSSCSTLARAKRPAPSQRINLAIIGYGTIAHSTTPNFLADDRVQIVAIADPVSDLPNYSYQGELRGGRLVGQKIVEAHYAQQAASGKFKGCRVYEDFRELLAREDVDAINISTPDHWHCAVAVYAARKGKHIYGQKPLALTVSEGRRISDETVRAGVTWQTGSQQRSTEYFRTAAEFVRNGRLGKIQGIKIGLPGGHSDWSKLAARNKPETPPKELNYDLWLGPAPERPYIPALLQLNWRHNWDFSGGMITDWGAHHVDIMQWALGMDASGPVAIENIRATLPPQTELYNTPTDYNFDIAYANGIRANVSNKHPNGLLFEGENGRSLFVSREKLEMNPADLRKEKIRDNEIHLYKSKLHERNFVDCIYDGKPTITPAEVSHRSITVGHLANIAIRLGRERIAWDPAAEKVVNDAAANAMLTRPMRAAYAI